MINNKQDLTKALLKASSQIIKGDQAKAREFTSFTAVLVSLVLQEGAAIDKKYVRKITEILQNKKHPSTREQRISLHLDCCIKILNEYLDCASFSKTNLDNYFTSLIALFNLETSGKLNISSNSYPSRIHVETLALCNAKCSFCDYKQLARKGEKMPDALIDKILDDLSDIPESHTFVITPYKVSEPFLDSRIGSIVDKFLSFHKRSKVEIISNGNYIPEKHMKELQEISNSSPKCLSDKNALSFAFSLNEVDQSRYESLMKLSYKRTLHSLKELHNLYSKEFFNASIRLTRVSTNAKIDAEFRDFCAKNFPNFECSLLKLNDWASSNQFSTNILNSTVNHRNLYGDSPCHRWTDLSIMANGDLALCCMDSGINSHHLGNVKNENCLKLYFKKTSRFIPASLQRKDAPMPCKDCTYFQSTYYSKDLSKKALTLAINLATLNQ